MASIGHVAVGLAAGRFHAGERPPAPAMVVFTILAMFPDLDVFAHEVLGVGWRSPWFHRGALHSLPVAVLAGLLAAAAGGLGRTRVRMALTAICVAASHGILDAMTDGGQGIALFWPFTARRYFAEWQFIPVAPIGIRFVSLRGVRVLAAEALIFAPLLGYALWPRRRAVAAAPPAA